VQTKTNVCKDSADFNEFAHDNVRRDSHPSIIDSLLVMIDKYENPIRATRPVGIGVFMFQE